jgi:Fe-S cluster biosynthesis and repair protein YggX
MGCSGGGSPVAARIEPGGRKVFCVKFQKEMPGLSEVPFEGHPLGQKVYENVSKEGWSMWLEHMKMLMNEYRLNLGTHWRGGRDHRGHGRLTAGRLTAHRA